ncbi:MAG: hypothetical protein ACI8Z1_001362 [Candidatus Azotimanducaceae bacterium]|jgi:hypothetical protein
MIRSCDLIIYYMQQKTRACPLCEQGKLEVAELPRGAQCSYCRKVIELDIVCWTGIPALLGLILTIAFSNDVNFVGYICAGLLVVYSAGFEKLIVPLLPLKHYGDFY